MVLPLCWDCCRLVKRAHPAEIVKESFVGRFLNAVDIYSRVADLAIATSPNHVCGRVHVRQAFDTRQWNQRRRASDCRVPLDACLCWRWDVVPMLPRLHRHEVCLRAPNLPRPVHCKTKTAFQPRSTLAGALLRAFACRCGACGVGYYGVSGRCHECGHRSLVLFLAYAVPILTILPLTCFLFWSGTFALPRHPQRPCLIAWVMAIQ